MNELALFAGAGGGILAGKLLGWTTVCAVECDDYAASILVARQNDRSLQPFPIWDDVCTFDGKPWRGLVDVVSGGFPCQAYSKASRGQRTADDLWPEMRRIVADVAPWYVFAENTSRDAIRCAADDLSAMGYETKLVALAARDLGADHIRQRYWLRAHANNESQLLRGLDAEMADGKRIRPGVWETFASDSRMADGMAYRVERYSATGNGQVPAVAAAAWNLLATQQKTGMAGHG
jgi:DNA (cytosine-5)-methyltransferase 1